MHVAQKSVATRRARDSMHHMLLTANSQLSGHIVACSKYVDVSVDSSLLHLTLEIGFMQRFLLYCCELAEAKPLEHATGLKAQTSILGDCFMHYLCLHVSSLLRFTLTKPSGSWHLEVSNIRRLD